MIPLSAKGQKGRYMAPNILGEGRYFLAGDYLAAIRDFALSKGVGANRLLRGSGLPLEALLNPPQRIGDLSMHQVGRNLIAELDEPMVGAIEYGRRLTLNRHGALGVAIQGAKNLLEASDLLVQYIETRSNFKAFQKVVEDDYVAIRISQKLGNEQKPLNEVRLFFDFATLINIEALGRQLLGRDSSNGITRINIDLPEPDDFPYHLLKGSIEVYFNQPYFELCVPMEWMLIPLSIGDAELAQLAANQCENELQALHAKDLIREVRNRIRFAEDAKPTIDEMAAQLYMSTSTLQRRLKEQNTTYQKLKAEERLIEAKELLKNSSITLEAISEKLGFSNASNFTKSFKSWAGVTPKEFREAQSGI